MISIDALMNIYFEKEKVAKPVAMFGFSIVRTRMRPTRLLYSCWTKPGTPESGIRQQVDKYETRSIPCQLL
jgi:hypothetical protein